MAIAPDCKGVYKTFCENCNKEHNGSYGSGRFCSKECAKSFSTKNKRKLINEKVSNSLKGRIISDLTSKKISEAGKGKRHTEETKEKIRKSKLEFYKEEENILKISIAHLSQKGKNINSILDVSSRTVTKILKRLKIGCSLCGWDKATCDLHHIKGRKVANPNAHSNLTYICPNCHRLVHAGLVDSKELVTLEQHIGDRWKEYYFA